MGKKSNTKIYVGIDIGDISNQICVLDSNGDILEQTSIENTVSGINAFFDQFETPKDVLIAIETGTHSPWISQLLEARGFLILVGNTRKLRAIWETDNKTDVRNAKMLARIARFDSKLLYPIKHRSRAAHMDLAVIKGRDALVKCRTGLINFDRGRKSWLITQFLSPPNRAGGSPTHGSPVGSSPHEGLTGF